MLKFNYIADTLLKNEKLLYSSRPHWIIFSSRILAFLAAIWFSHYGMNYPLLKTIFFRKYYFYQIIAVVSTIMAIWWGIIAMFKYSTSEYAVTNERVLMKTGWIYREAMEIFLHRIESTQIEQSILGRLLNCGTVIIVGTGGTQDKFPFVPKPLLFRKIVQQQTKLILHKQERS